MPRVGDKIDIRPRGEQRNTENKVGKMREKIDDVTLLLTVLDCGQNVMSSNIDNILFLWKAV